jgi:methyl-accepting chemotaxis protein
MKQKTRPLTPLNKKRRHWFSLSIRISLGLMFAAIMPLFLTLAFTYLVTRPALINQYTTAMQSDASTRVQLINSYLAERVGDAKTLAHIPSIETFLTLPITATPAEIQDATIHATYGLAAGRLKDSNYVAWVLFNTQGLPVLAYPQPQDSPFVRQAVPAQERTDVTNGKTFISAVFYSSEAQKAFVNIYVPITNQDLLPPGTNASMIGFARATLTIDYIWNNIVQKDQGNNGAGSYAFILDENGIRIADTIASERFTSVAPLPPDVQQQIMQDARFGKDTNVAVKADTFLAQHLHDHNATVSFQEQPAGKNEDFQVVQQATDTTLVPWKYFVLSPLKVVTSLAIQQLLTTLLVAVVVSAIVALIGLFAGRRLTHPIMHAVASLQNNSEALSTLATNQQDAASEQVWVVESSQTGLESVRYYTEASRLGIQRLHAATALLVWAWQQGNTPQMTQMLEQIISTTQYLEKATEHQATSNQQLATALKVTTQVTEQLHNGTTAATLAAKQLGEVVRELRKVVGR